MQIRINQNCNQSLRILFCINDFRVQQNLCIILRKMSLNSPERERCSEACTGFFSSEADFIFRGQNRVRREFGLQPHGIAPTFLKLDLGSPGAGFIPITSTKVINQMKKEIF